MGPKRVGERWLRPETLRLGIFHLGIFHLGIQLVGVLLVGILLVGVLLVGILLLGRPAIASAQGPGPDPGGATAAKDADPCRVEGPRLAWWGSQPTLTAAQLAAYVAPVFWFSPDEPNLHRARGEDIRIPEAFSFESAPDAPVVYYQIEEVVSREDAGEGAYRLSGTDFANATLDLSQIGAIRISYLAYFATEEGLGAHPHDIEPAEFKLVVVRTTDPVAKEYLRGDCSEVHYALLVTRVTGKAHGLSWYWNVLETDSYTELPMHLLVEEGKHALATDKNADGYFTPGYDVNRRINDAWGVRDVIRQGMLFTGGYQAWMSKVRRPEHRIFPPLPPDSPLLDDLEDMQAGVPGAVYELRPFPTLEQAGEVEALHHLMVDKVRPEGPDLHQAAAFSQVGEWMGEGAALKSLSIALRADGDLGVSFVFPFFVIKNFEDPMTGGFIVHRMYLKDTNLRDFGWMIMYTPSASRWIDTYVAAGVEWDDEVAYVDSLAAEVKTSSTDFVFETGLKFRVNVMHSPMKFMAFLTEFWGFRAGIKNKGFFDIDELTYVLELGAGVW